MTPTKFTASEVHDCVQCAYASHRDDQSIDRLASFALTLAHSLICSRDKDEERAGLALQRLVFDCRDAKPAAFTPLEPNAAGHYEGDYD